MGTFGPHAIGLGLVGLGVLSFRTTLSMCDKRS